MPTSTKCCSWSSANHFYLGHTLRTQRYGNLSKRSFPYREPRPQPCEKPNAFRLCMSIIMVIIGIYILLSILLICSMPHIIEACASRWEVEVINFDISFPPIWKNNPLIDFRHLPPGTDRYANISFSLAIANNPWWLMVNVFTTEISIGRLGKFFMYPHSMPLYNNGTYQFHWSVPWAGLNEAACVCLAYARSFSHSVVLNLQLGAHVYVLGYNSGRYRLLTSVRDRSQGRDVIAPNLGKTFGKGCLRHMKQHVPQALGKIAAVNKFPLFETALPLPAL